MCIYILSLFTKSQKSDVYLFRQGIFNGIHFDSWTIRVVVYHVEVTFYLWSTYFK